jgi:beta-lactamase superfamily II metal-dependent hydrolase
VIEVAFLDVGNADSIVVITPKRSAIVIDVPRPLQVESWLNQQDCSAIDAVFFTHNHRDHTPALDKLVVFLNLWLRTGTIAQVYLPTEYIATAIDNPLLEDALEKLVRWDSREFAIERAEKRPSPIKLGDIDVRILHPSFLFVEQHRKRMKPNEPSLVLSLEYGEFRSLLLADIEGAGLETLLGYTDDNDLKCNIIKIPHHGAWQPQNAEMLQQLFDRADAEFAVLSVGSTNPHGHVVPQLFVELLKRQKDVSSRLARFVCTEVTRTCVHTSAERKRMGKKGKQGLAQKRPCAGNVVIQAKPDGSWLFQTEAEHDLRLQTIERPACLGQADL